MALRIIVNSVEQRTVKMAVTDSTNTEVADDHVYNIGGGQRYIGYLASSEGERTLNYINKSALLSADTVVVTNASLIDGHYIAAKSYSSYPGTSSVVASETLSGTFVGPNGQDWVGSFSSAQSNKEAFGLQLGQSPADDTGFTATCGKVYFGSALELSYPQSAEVTPLPLGSRISVHRQSYLVSESWVFTAINISREDIRTFKNLHRLRDEPIFIYDPLGKHIDHKLLHGILVGFKERAAHNDLYTLQLTFAALRQW